jgi:hypothetical protein
VRRRSTLHLLRATSCLLVGLAICGHSAYVLLFGGILWSFFLGGGPALLLIGAIDLYYWYDD